MAMRKSTSCFVAYTMAVVIPNIPTDIKEVPMAFIILKFVLKRSAGTIKKPPPIPKKPDRIPTKKSGQSY